jgi:hypothetical protein
MNANTLTPQAAALPYILSLMNLDNVSAKDAALFTKIFHSMPAADRIDEDAVGRHLGLIQLMLRSVVRYETNNTISKSGYLQTMLSDINRTVSNFAAVTGASKQTEPVH